jgi:hypothetical protein
MHFAWRYVAEYCKTFQIGEHEQNSETRKAKYSVQLTEAHIQGSVRIISAETGNPRSQVPKTLHDDDLYPYHNQKSTSMVTVYDFADG